MKTIIVLVFTFWFLSGYSQIYYGVGGGLSLKGNKYADAHLFVNVGGIVSNTFLIESNLNLSPITANHLVSVMAGIKKDFTNPYGNTWGIHLLAGTGQNIYWNIGYGELSGQSHTEIVRVWFKNTQVQIQYSGKLDRRSKHEVSNNFYLTFAQIGF